MVTTHQVTAESIFQAHHKFLMISNFKIKFTYQDETYTITYRKYFNLAIISSL